MPSYLIADGSELEPEWLDGVEDRRHHRRRVGAGSAGRGRDRRAAPARAGRGLDPAGPRREHRIPSARRAGGASTTRNDDQQRTLIAGWQQKRKVRRMAVPFLKEMRIGAYLLKQKLHGPQALSARADAGAAVPLQPRLRRLRQDRLSGRRSSTGACRCKECLDAVDECGAPMVAIPGGEPLIHKEIGEIVEGIVARKKFVSLCTNALLLEKKLHLFEPSPYLFFSVHLDGLKEHHDKSVCQDGVLRQGGRRRSRPRKAKGFTVNVNARSSTAIRPRTSRRSSTSARSSASASRSRPATPTSARPTRSTSSTAARPRSCSARSSRAARARSGSSSTPPLFLDFLAGNQDLSLHAVGHADAQHLRLAEALLSARRRLREDLQGADGDHRLGHLRHRQVREVRELHGALRLRADRRRRDARAIRSRR